MSVLEVKGLNVRFQQDGAEIHAVRDVSFHVQRGETLALVGESGSGKSVTALSTLRLLPDSAEVSGSATYQGREMLTLPEHELRRVRGNDISFIFQEPMTSLNPVFRIGMQIAEVLMAHEGISEKEAEQRAVEMLRLVGIPDPEKRIHDYPHQFSGGMRQRVMIAIALACNPALLIADEPTTALDVTIQAQIIELMLELKERRKEAAILLITHDLAVVAETCQRVIVMYGGKIQEIAEVGELFRTPLHPYTRGLMGSIPRPEDEHSRNERLHAIPGNVPSIMNLPVGCKFCTRCTEKKDLCETTEPPLIEITPDHFVRCHIVPTAMEGGQRYE